MLDTQKKRKVSSRPFPSVRERESCGVFSPLQSTAVRSQTAARWFRVYRTMDSSPLRQLSYRNSRGLPVRSSRFKSVGVKINISAKESRTSRYATPDKGRKRERMIPVQAVTMSRLSLVVEPKQMLPLRRRPKKLSVRRIREDGLTPWEHDYLAISPMSNTHS